MDVSQTRPHNLAGAIGREHESARVLRMNIGFGGFSYGNQMGMSQNSASRDRSRDRRYPQVLVHISIYQGSILGTNF